MYYVGTWVGHFWNDDNHIQNSIYKSIDLTDTGEGWGVKLNTLSSEGWKVLSIIPYGIEDRVFSEISQQQDWGFISLFVLQRPIQE